MVPLLRQVQVALCLPRARTLVRRHHRCVLAATMMPVLLLSARRRLLQRVAHRLNVLYRQAGSRCRRVRTLLPQQCRLRHPLQVAVAQMEQQSV